MDKQIIVYDDFYNIINIEKPCYIMGKSILNTEQNKKKNNEQKILNLIKELNDLKNKSY